MPFPAFWEKIKQNSKGTKMALKNLKSNTFWTSACNYKFHLFFYFVNIV